MEFLPKVENVLAKPGWLSRRIFLQRLVKGSIAVAGLAAGIKLDNAYAANYLCCNLAYPNNICKTYDPCPCGGSYYEWTCRYNGCMIVCGECWSCDCSYAYQACSPGCPCAPGAPSADSLIRFLPMREPGTCH